MPLSTDLDLLPTAELVAMLAEDHRRAVEAVCQVAGDIARAADAAAPLLEANGRLIYCGAGTSGRLGQLDAVELLPTFSWAPTRALGLMAGGPVAFLGAVENAEDDAEAGARDLHALGVGANDVVICIAASGRTPFTLGALLAARAAGALTLGLANVPNTPILNEAHHAIVLDTGSEVLLGSTRLKAGTAQKVALNTFSTALMVRLHKVYGNLMVDVQPTNAKLRERATALVTQVTGCAPDSARNALQACGWRVKHAILVQRLGVDVAAAEQRLAQSGGSLRRALSA